MFWDRLVQGEKSDWGGCRDITVLYKIMHSMERIVRENFFSLSLKSRNRSHPIKLTGRRLKQTKRSTVHN